MPELPEVETLRKQLEPDLTQAGPITAVTAFRRDIRDVIPVHSLMKLAGFPVVAVGRRAKYLLFTTEKGAVISHLGMSGSWRWVDASDPREIHDHFALDFAQRRLVYHDPRRFGVIDCAEKGEELAHPRFKGLGPEPLDEAALSPGDFFRSLRGRRTPIKAAIMDQRVVVGVGNIYASEALFAAGIRPTRAAHRLSQLDAAALLAAIRTVLQAAIALGGSTIRDFAHANGSSGAAQGAHRVYARAGQPCFVCGTKVRTKVISGRSTFWCSNCQS